MTSFPLLAYLCFTLALEDSAPDSCAPAVRSGKGVTWWGGARMAPMTRVGFRGAGVHADGDLRLWPTTWMQGAPQREGAGCYSDAQLIPVPDSKHKSLPELPQWSSGSFYTLVPTVR